MAENEENTSSTTLPENYSIARPCTPTKEGLIYILVFSNQSGVQNSAYVRHLSGDRTQSIIKVWIPE